MDKIMKYLKEGKWEDFKSDIDPYVSEIKQLKVKIRKLTKEMKAKTSEVEKEYLSIVGQCMVDLEDYSVEYVSDNSSNALAYYSYKIKAIKLDLIKDLCVKLESEIGNENDAWEIRWECYHKNGVGLENLNKKVEDRLLIRKNITGYIELSIAFRPIFN